MENIRKPKLPHCRCACHICIQHVNPEFFNFNKSLIIPEPIERNNSYRSLNNNSKIPLFSSKSVNDIRDNEEGKEKEKIILDEINNEEEMSGSNIRRKNNLMLRVQAIRDKIDRMILLKNKNQNERLDLNNNIEQNNINKFTFYETPKLSKKGKSPYFKRYFENEIKLENPHLKNLLKAIPRHEKDKYKINKSNENYELVFTNGLFRKKSDSVDKKYIGNESMVMPPNNISRIN
jgi:hypothetical protein